MSEDCAGRPPSVPRRGTIAALGAIAALLGGCATLPAIPRDGMLAPPVSSADGLRDLRGEFRAALCARPEMVGDRCERTLQRLANEQPAPAPAAARGSAFRLVFVPGFLSSCFPAFSTFEDAMHEAADAGYEVHRLEVGGRAGVAANAAKLAEQVAALPDDARRIVFVTHSKGALDTLEFVVARPDLGERVAAVVTVAGALRGSPLAESFAGLYALALASNPLLPCARGAGSELSELRPDVRELWWREHGEALGVPVYSLVALPDGDRISPVLRWMHALLSNVDPRNDGQLLARDQVAPSGALLGYVNADHLEAAIPRPRRLPWTLLMASADVPRASLVLAAVDVVVADLQRSGHARR